jgi:hypothetical protein
VRRGIAFMIKQDKGDGLLSFDHPSGTCTPVTHTRYDADGRTTESRLPGDATGTTPRTTDTVHYAHGTGASASDTSAGLVYSTAPAAQPSGGNPVAVTTNTYDQYGATLTTTETYGTSGTVRTSTTTYDAAGRAATSSTAVTPTAVGGTAHRGGRQACSTSSAIRSTTRFGCASRPGLEPRKHSWQ